MIFSSQTTSIITTLSYMVAKILYYKDFAMICNFISKIKLEYSLTTKDTVTILMAAEDKRFLSHCGFDIIAIARSIFLYIFTQRLCGASTIDQQLIRTITQYKERTIKRKIKEIIIASAINKLYDKNFIAKTYLTIAYYGWNMHGINDAYLRIKSENVIYNDDIKHTLISLLKYPLPRCPSDTSLAKVNNRIRYIKRRIKQLGWHIQEHSIGEQYEIEQMGA